MDALRDDQRLSFHLHRFASETARLFDWVPSQQFLSNAARLARSAGQSNVEDFFALLSCETSEWHDLRRKGRFFRSAFSTAWGLALVRKVLAEQPEGGAADEAAARAEVERLSEDGLAALLSRHVAENPKRYQARSHLPHAEILWEDTIIRSLDRERQQWRRERDRKRELEAAVSYLDDPSSRLVAAETIRCVCEFVETHLGEDEQTLFWGRFEQGLSDAELASILGVTQPTIRQRIRRMRQKVGTSLAGILK